MPKAKAPIEKLHCGECQFVMKAHKLHPEITVCPNTHCPQHMSKFPLPNRYRMEPSAA